MSEIIPVVLAAGVVILVLFEIAKWAQSKQAVSTPPASAPAATTAPTTPVLTGEHVVQIVQAMATPPVTAPAAPAQPPKWTGDPTKGGAMTWFNGPGTSPPVQFTLAEPLHCQVQLKSNVNGAVTGGDVAGIKFKSGDLIDIPPGAQAATVDAGRATDGVVLHFLKR